MNLLNKNTEIILFDKKIGLITSNEVIFEEKRKQVKIELATINKVSLSKHRVYISNAIILLIGVFLVINTHIFFRNNKIEVYYSLLGISFLVLLFSFYHKFYFYKIDFRKKKEVIYTYKTSQLQRNNIKTFYNCLRNVIKEKTIAE